MECVLSHWECMKWACTREVPHVDEFLSMNWSSATCTWTQHISQCGRRSQCCSICFPGYSQPSAGMSRCSFLVVAMLMSVQSGSFRPLRHCRPVKWSLSGSFVSCECETVVCSFALTYSFAISSVTAVSSCDPGQCRCIVTEGTIELGKLHTFLS